MSQGVANEPYAIGFLGYAYQIEGDMPDAYSGRAVGPPCECSKTSDEQADCTAARAAVEELEDAYIRGYQQVYTLPGIRARPCQDTNHCFDDNW